MYKPLKYLFALIVSATAFLFLVLALGCSSNVKAQLCDESSYGRITFSYVNSPTEFNGSIYACDQTGVLYFVDDRTRYGNTSMIILYKANGLPMTLSDLQ